MINLENEILNLSALVGSIKANAEKIEATENVKCLAKGIKDMCEIASEKLTILQKEVKENV